MNYKNPQRDARVIVENTVALFTDTVYTARRYVPVSAEGDDEYADSGDVTCLPRCRGDVTFRTNDKRFAATWQVVWASLSMTSSLVTLLTFIIDSARFRYPERPVVFIALSRYVLIDLFYLLYNDSNKNTGFKTHEQDNKGALKMQDRKLQDRKMWD